MSAPQNGRISQLSGRRARSARARGLRTLQHQALARSTLQAIEAEIWLRTLIVERSRAEGVIGPLADPVWATKDQVHDEALAWFLQGHAGVRLEPPAPVTPRRSASGQRGGADARQDVTFWLDSRLLARARKLAAREGLRLALLIERAFGAYVQAQVSSEVLRFHRRAQGQALRLYQRRSGI